MFHIHDVFAMAIGKNFDILAEREKKLFDEKETENPSIDWEREMTSSKTVAKEETEDSQGANKEDFLLNNSFRRMDPSAETSSSKLFHGCFSGEIDTSCSLDILKP